MRICIVTIAGSVHGIGGMQRHTSDLARGLSEAGHDVVVITKRHPEGIWEERHDGALWRFVDTSAHQLDPAWLQASYDAFRVAHAERPFDVVHSESTCALGLVLNGVQHEVPITVKYHGNFVGLAKANAQRAIRRRTPKAVAQEGRSFVWLCHQHFPRGNWWRFHGFESMVPSRQQVRQTCLSHCVRSARMHVVRNGVDVTLFHPRDKAATRTALGLGEEPIVLALGRLNREKGHHTAIAALAQLEPPARLMIVGDGEDRGRLEGLARSLGVADRVTFAGGQPPDVVARYLAASDAFVFPTERDEGAPMELVEAMASGVPVVASRIEQIAEVVDCDGENGFLVRTANVSETVVALRTILSDPGRARAVGERGRERVLAGYTLEQMVEETVAVYQLAIDQASS
jgi:glycosyltransferase involved in cell wall biosynthesis